MFCFLFFLLQYLPGYSSSFLLPGCWWQWVWWWFWCLSLSAALTKCDTVGQACSTLAHMYVSKYFFATRVLFLIFSTRFNASASSSFHLLYCLVTLLIFCQFSTLCATCCSLCCCLATILNYNYILYMSQLKS